MLLGYQLLNIYYYVSKENFSVLPRDNDAVVTNFGQPYCSSGTWLSSWQLIPLPLHYSEVACWVMWCMIALIITCTMDSHPKIQQKDSRWEEILRKMILKLVWQLLGSWLYILMMLSCLATALSPEPSLQSSNHGLWNNIFSMGQRVRDFATALGEEIFRKRVADWFFYVEHLYKCCI